MGNERYWNDLSFSENAIEWLRGDNRITCTFCTGGRLYNRLLKLSKERPEEVELTENEDGSICGTVPLSWLKLSAPRIMTEEERLRLRENGASTRFGADARAKTTKTVQNASGDKMPV